MYRCLAHSQASHKPLVQQVALDVICEYFLDYNTKTQKVMMETEDHVVYVLLVTFLCQHSSIISLFAFVIF